MKHFALPVICGALFACSPGVSPESMTAPKIVGDAPSCRGESLDLSPDGRWIAVTCRDFSASIIEVDPAKLDTLGAMTSLPKVGSGEGIRFHPSGAFAALSAYREAACPQGNANPQCQSPFGSEVVILGFPQSGAPASLKPAVIDRWPVAQGDTSCLAGEDVAFSADGRRLAVICNLPSQVFVFDADPASEGFGQVLHRVDVPAGDGRTGWLDEVVINADGSRIYISELDGEQVKSGVVQVVDGAAGKLKTPIKAPHMLVGLHLDPSGSHLVSTAWQVGAARIDLAKPAAEDGILMLRYDGGGFSYDLTTGSAPGGRYGYAVTQYPARLDVYDFDTRKRGSVALPDVRSRQPTATVPRRDGQRLYVQHEVGKVIIVDPQLPAPEAYVAQFTLDAPCQGEASLSWSAPGATAVKINGAEQKPEGAQVVMSEKTRRHTLEATFPQGKVITSTVQWRPEAKVYSGVCGQVPTPVAPAPAEPVPAEPVPTEQPVKQPAPTPPGGAAPPAPPTP
ncbi:MAG: YncE family protein [Bradymonadia bacterium]